MSENLYLLPFTMYVSLYSMLCKEDKNKVLIVLDNKLNLLCDAALKMKITSKLSNSYSKKSNSLM